MTIQKRYTDVVEKVATAAFKAGRKADDVTLIAVSKTFDAEHIEPVLQCSHLHFGENRVQEAYGKWPDLKEKYPDTVLHLIGPLQTNKAKDAIGLFDCIETLDREKLAKVLAKETQSAGQCPALFVQVNTGVEPQKAGILPDDADSFIRKCQTDYDLSVSGLMCIPPFDEDPRDHFKLLAAIAERNGLQNLSMGMSGDYEIAIEHGATHVRVGSAIFGSRG